MTSPRATPAGDARPSALDETSPHPSDDRELPPTLSEAPPQPGERLLPGTEVGEYLVEEMIGEGGFGAVYAARHPVIGKRAAIKVLSKAFSSDADLSARFVNEARAVNTIRHKNIVDIFAFGRLKDERLYFIMEILEGEALDSLLRRKERLSVAEAMPIFRAVARALDATHAAEIVHRDLKPANVFLAVDGEGEIVPKLLDFGIAKVAGQAASSSSGQTKTGTVLGTPWYMSPEQCRGEGVGPRADVYSFGVMLHRALTGHLPFEGTNAFDVAVAQATQAPPTMSSVEPELPVELDAPVLRMLEKNAADRPASPGEALEAFAQAARAVGLWGEPDTPRTGPRLVPVPAPTPSRPSPGQTMPDTEMWAPIQSFTPSVAPNPWPRRVILVGLLGAAVAGFSLLRQTAQISQNQPPPALPSAAAAEPPTPPTLTSLTAASSVAPVPSEAPSAAPASSSKVKPSSSSKPKSSDIPKDFEAPTF